MDNSKEEKIYTGNYILTSNGFILFGFFIFSCYMTYKGVLSGNNRYLASIIVLIVLFSAFTHGMNYFILTDKKLIIKNPIWFWKVMEFDLDIIENISIVQPFRSPICLDIKTENKTKLIRASSLRNRTWKKLKRDLEGKNIIVYDRIGWD